MVTPADVVVKSLKYIKKAFCGYLPQSEGKKEALEQLKEVFTTTRATTMYNGCITTSGASPRVN